MDTHHIFLEKAEVREVEWCNQLMEKIQGSGWIRVKLFVLYSSQQITELQVPLWAENPAVFSTLCTTSNNKDDEIVS